MTSNATFELPADPRLVVTDMDGTLLDGEGRVPDGLWEVLGELESRGIAFAPASGRQLASLEQVFAPYGGNLSFVADNGALTMHDGEIVNATLGQRDGAVRFVLAARQASDPRNSALVWGVDGHKAFVECADRSHADDILQYFGEATFVDDVLAAHDGPPLKLSFYDASGIEPAAAPGLVAAAAPNRVLQSSVRWMDVTNAAVDKAVGVAALQGRMGITPDQTMVFGDYLNDMGMISSATWSYAMANGHPDILARAAHRAPSNTEHGVLQVLRALLER